MKDWESKYKNQELLRKKEQRNQANNSEYFYRQCLTLKRKIFEMEVNLIFPDTFAQWYRLAIAMRMDIAEIPGWLWTSVGGRHEKHDERRRWQQVNGIKITDHRDTKVIRRFHRQ